LTLPLHPLRLVLKILIPAKRTLAGFPNQQNQLEEPDPMLSIDRRTALLQMSAVAGAAFLTETARAEGSMNGQTPAAPASALASTQATGPFTLPPLPYAYDALEPYFDAETMHLHHDKHHQAYVNNLNAAVAAHPELGGKSVEDLLKSLGTILPASMNAVRNNGGGHFNHSFWWPTLGKGGAAPTGELAKAIDAKFGSLSGFQEKLTAAALSVFGSGWAWLVKLPDGSVTIQTTPNQDATISAGLNPVLGVDVWEHAYYLKYQNKRTDYVKAFFQALNWDYVSGQFAKKA